MNRKGPTYEALKLNFRGEGIIRDNVTSAVARKSTDYFSNVPVLEKKKNQKERGAPSSTGRWSGGGHSRLKITAP